MGNRDRCCSVTVAKGVCSVPPRPNAAQGHLWCRRVRALGLPFAAVLVAACARAPEHRPVETLRDNPMFVPQVFLEDSARPAPRKDEGIEAIKVTDPGEEPRQVVRFRYPADESHWEYVQLNTDMSFQVGSMNPENETMPATRITVLLRTRARGPDGSALREYEISKASLVAFPEAWDPEQKKDAMRELKKIVGLRGRLVMGANGAVQKGEPAIGKGKADRTVAKKARAVQQAMERSSLMWPDEPIGINATWVHKTMDKIEEYGITYLRKTTYKLTGFKDGIATITATVDQGTRQKQPFMGPKVPDGALVSLDRLAGEGTAVIRMRLDGVMTTADEKSSFIISGHVSIGRLDVPMLMKGRSASLVRASL